jgi:hypothetical protein
MEQARQDSVILDQMRAEARDRVRYLGWRIREEPNRITTEQLEWVSVFDLTDDLEWLL